jgi:hypothetical protein
VCLPSQAQALLERNGWRTDVDDGYLVLPVEITADDLLAYVRAQLAPAVDSEVAKGSVGRFEQPGCCFFFLFSSFFSLFLGDGTLFLPFPVTIGADARVACTLNLGEFSFSSNLVSVSMHELRARYTWGFPI